MTRPRKTTPKDTVQIEPLMTDAALDFYSRHVIDPAMEELRAGMPLPRVLTLTYTLGLWHAQQLSEPPGKKD